MYTYVSADVRSVLSVSADGSMLHCLGSFGSHARANYQDHVISGMGRMAGHDGSVPEVTPCHARSEMII